MPRTHRIIGCTPTAPVGRLRISPLAVAVAGLLLHATVTAQTPPWDCRAAIGGGWECGTAVEPSTAPPAAAAPKPAAATPAPTATVPEPAAAAPEPAAAVPEPATAVPKPAAATAPAVAVTPPAAVKTPPAQPPAAPAAPVDASRDRHKEAPPGPAATPAAGPTEQGAVGQPEPSVRATTRSLDEGIDWGACQLLVGAPPSIQLSETDDSGLPIEASADSAAADLNAEQATLHGDVDLVRGDTRLQADEVVVNRLTSAVDARGNILLQRPDIRMSGERAEYQLDSRQGRVEQASYRVPAAHARGDAASAELVGPGISRYNEITYSTCQPGDDAWLLSANALEIDQNEGFGTARNATLRFMGAPILYAPWFTFPTDNRRRSGLLVPSVGHTGNTGFDLSVPYYFNLAENYDLTLTPRYMSRRGALLGGEFRFLTRTGRGELKADYLPNDREYGSARGSASLRANAGLAPRLTGALRLNYASDSQYLEDLGSSLAVTSTTHLERAGELRYFGDDWDLLGRVQQYQTIDERIPARNRPYSRLPQLRLDLFKPDGLAGTNYLLDAEYVNFYRDDSVRGHRVQLFPRIGLPLRRSWGYIEPRVGAHFVSYMLTDQIEGLDDSPSSLAGTFSLDGGLYFDRGMNYFGNAATQTLEPRLYYLYVPRVDQDDQPVFDTGVFDFNFDNLFRENRFNGPDRFGDANQLTLALTSRVFSDQSGAELLRASVGQTLYFADREVTLPGETVREDNSSAFVGEIAAALGGGWRARAGIQWDPDADDGGNVDQGLAQITYHDQDRRTLNLAYRLRDEVTEQTDLAFVWPVNDRWSVIGRHNHSLQDDRLLEALLGVEYGRCCWRVRALARQYTDGTGDDHNLGFFLQLELNGLGRLGDDIDEVLDTSIYGYRTDYQ